MHVFPFFFQVLDFYGGLLRRGVANHPIHPPRIRPCKWINQRLSNSMFRVDEDQLCSYFRKSFVCNRQGHLFNICRTRNDVIRDTNIFVCYLDIAHVQYFNNNQLGYCLQWHPRPGCLVQSSFSQICHTFCAFVGVWVRSDNFRFAFSFPQLRHLQNHDFEQCTPWQVFTCNEMGILIFC